MIRKTCFSPVYLSVDLDYWRADESPKDCREFFEQVFALELPILVAMAHHHLIDDVDASACDEIYNVDWHSDLPEERCATDNFNEGTWGAHVSWRAHGRFEWRYPRDACLSNRSGGGYTHDDANPFTDPECTKWWKTKLRKGTKAIPWRRVSRIGVSMSPHWVGPLRIIDYPLRKLKVMDLMRESVAMCEKGAGDPLHNIDYYPLKTRVVR